MRENPKLTYHIRGIGSIWFDMVRCRGRRPLNGTRTREHEPGNPPLSDCSDIRILLYDGSDVGAPYLAPSCPGKGPRTRSANSRIRHALSHLEAGLRIGRPRGRDRWRDLTSPLRLGRKRLCKLSLHSTRTHTRSLTHASIHTPAPAHTLARIHPHTSAHSHTYAGDSERMHCLICPDSISFHGLLPCCYSSNRHFQLVARP